MRKENVEKRESQSSFNSTPRSHKATKSKAGVSAYWMPTAIGHKNMAMGSEPESYEPSKFEAPSATSLSYLSSPVLFSPVFFMVDGTRSI
jgi:hypothetical protein